MTFKQYQTRNNIVGYLDAGISPTGEDLILKPEYADLFPEITEENPRSYLATVEQFDIENRISKREIVEVIQKTANVLKIVRSAGFCPSSYNSTEYTNTAFSFLAGDKISMYVVSENDEDVKQELNRKAYDDEVVHKTGNEIIDGVKTLKKFPEKQGDLLPNQPQQFATKQYVDDKAGTGFNIVEDCVYENGLLISFVGNGTLHELIYNAGILEKIKVGTIEYNINVDDLLRLEKFDFIEL